MKKIFPVIVVLISLSLLGIILLQVNWFKNLLLVQEERFLFKVDRAGVNVAAELSKQASANTMFRLQRKPGLTLLPDELSYALGRFPTISEQYTQKEILDKLNNAFTNEGLKKINFEFAITSNSNEFVLEMQSAHFQEASLADTASLKREVIPIIPETGTNMEGLMAYEHLFIILPDFKKQLWQSLSWMIVASVIFTLIIIAAFYLTVKTLLNQKKLSEIKNDFINNMTHEFKTPLATISLAVDALKNEKVMNDPEKTQYFNSIIKDENKRMNKHVETILQAALLEKQELKLNMKPVHAHTILTQVLENFKLQLEEKHGRAELLLNATEDTILADEVHFTNLISNLIDNSIKYSKDNLLIKVITHVTGKSLVIHIEDNGMGMSKETVKRIFEKFYRAHTGNLHNVKGFGLGMSYVKTVVDAHKGKIKVESVLGKSTSFILEMPLQKNTDI